MTTQNIYDDPEFLAGYSMLNRQVRGLDGAAEWPVLRSMLPDLEGRRVVDLGCGFGWFCRWAAASGASEVEGIDVSNKMLERAQAESADGRIDFRCLDLEALDLAPDSIDVVYSSLVFHYVDDLARLVNTVSGALTPGGSLVFSVEHPIYSAPSNQSFRSTEDGQRYWPLDHYLNEGERVRSWFVDGVVKQHRTVATYIKIVIDSGLVVTRLDEFGSTTEPSDSTPEAVEDRHRPWFLLVSAQKPA